ncbi:hypothetical protein RRG08_030934 [Elysia crispata]|uniref:Uncharacterized protein n=1 Tax=Elysia crispata TaxID=231223 RepID=A0AAE1AAT2_9GAST|nr:hypothetical protein RRG08_030934 [Elysia crispata]
MWRPAAPPSTQQQAATTPLWVFTKPDLDACHGSDGRVRHQQTHPRSTQWLKPKHLSARENTTGSARALEIRAGTKKVFDPIPQNVLFKKAG